MMQMAHYLIYSHLFVHVCQLQARNQGGEAPLETFCPLEKCVGHSLKLFDTVQKIRAPLKKLFVPPSVPSWLRAWSAVWFKILSRIDICMKVIHVMQGTLNTEVANIQEILKDLDELRNNWQAVWNEVTTVASNLGIEIKLPPGESSAP